MRGELKQRRIKILHVDDEPDFLALTKAFLERECANFSVDTATSVEEGIEMLKNGKYDVVVSDYQMPGMDGLDFLRNLQQNGSAIAFIIFTGREEVVMEALNRGANGYLQKGGDITSMYGTLAQVIERGMKQVEKGKKLAEPKRERQRVLHSVPTMISYRQRKAIPAM